MKEAEGFFLKQKTFRNSFSRPGNGPY